ncbi:MAG TPA: response regulator transcription factor [Actinomycetota bacterium]|nr:response regulator transcription factor [Actinomycetota bacterium]
MADRVRVLVVDDHEMFGEALSLLFEREPDLELVARLASVERAIDVCRREAPDVILMDVDTRDPGGIEGLARLRRSAPAARVVVLTAPGNAALVANALAAGATGYVPKDRSLDELVGVVRRAADGEIVMPASDLARVFEHLRSRGRDAPGDGEAIQRLTGRETEILRALAEGGTTAEIADGLGISPLTVQSHVKSILAKLGVHSKIEADTLAWRHGLAQAPHTP